MNKRSDSNNKQTCVDDDYSLLVEGLTEMCFTLPKMSQDSITRLRFDKEITSKIGQLPLNPKINEETKDGLFDKNFLLLSEDAKESKNVPDCYKVDENDIYTNNFSSS